MVTADLYGVLGVARDADVKTVRDGYRRAAKRAHPDAGGSSQAFALVQLAHDCLTDPERRRRYDETGDAGEKTIDNRESNAREHAMRAMFAVIQKTAASQQDVKRVPLVDRAVAFLEKESAELDIILRNMPLEVAHLEMLARRVHARTAKSDVLGSMLRAAAASRSRDVEVLKGNRRLLERAIEILRDHTYDIDTPPKEHPHHGIASMMYTIMSGGV